MYSCTLVLCTLCKPLKTTGILYDRGGSFRHILRASEKFLFKWHQLNLKVWWLHAGYSNNETNAHIRIKIYNKVDYVAPEINLGLNKLLTTPPEHRLTFSSRQIVHKLNKYAILQYLHKDKNTFTHS